MASWAQPEVTITKLPVSLCDNATANSPTDAINKVSLSVASRQPSRVQNERTCAFIKLLYTIIFRPYA